MIVFNKSETLENKEEIISAIKAGKIFIYPTDTIYGIGCDATNEAAVAHLREIKKREEKPFSVVAPSKGWILENFEANDNSKLDLLPGPYTLVLNDKGKEAVAKNVFQGKLPGVRIPDSWFTSVIQASGRPFVTSSANISGEKNMEVLEDLPESFLAEVDYVIYDGPIFGKQSTRIDLTK